MKYPKLVPAWVCKTRIDIVLQAGETEDGAPAYIEAFSKKCNFQTKSVLTYKGERSDDNYTATALFDGDIVPSGIPIAGRATVNGTEYEIMGYQRNLNPDGTVNYTRLDLR